MMTMCGIVTSRPGLGVLSLYMRSIHLWMAWMDYVWMRPTAWKVPFGKQNPIHLRVTN